MLSWNAYDLLQMTEESDLDYVPDSKSLSVKIATAFRPPYILQCGLRGFEAREMCWYPGMAAEVCVQNIRVLTTFSLHEVVELMP